MSSPTVAGGGDPGHTSRGLQTALLRSVSRSLSPSIRFAPAKLSDPIARAYLPPRPTATVPDTGQICTSGRTQTTNLLSAVIQGTASRDVVAGLVAGFVPLQENTSERQLLESLHDCLAWLDRMEHTDKNDIRLVLEKIMRGQMLDLQRFDDPNEIRALGTAADLDEYTYLVAGCVGEVWTQLCCGHVRNVANRGQDEMMPLGKRDGMALQLMNVLRDAGSDLRVGRCYFPEYELTAAHLSPSQIFAEPKRFQPIYRPWLDKARAGLESGMEYSRAINNRRVRVATVLPALIGARTLALLDAEGAMVLQRTVKVPRREVRVMILSLGMSLASRGVTNAMFKRAADVKDIARKS